jgi:hypothetical protein
MVLLSTELLTDWLLDLFDCGVSSGDDSAEVAVEDWLVMAFAETN